MKHVVWGLVAAVACSGGFPASEAAAQDLNLANMWMLQNEQVRKELEIVDEQMEKIRELQSRLRTELQDTFGGLRDLDAETRRERMAEMRERMQERQRELAEQVQDVLLPHQLERLQQIGTQMQMQARGASAALADGPLAERLGITDEQRRALREAAAEARREMEEKIAEARKEAEEKVLQALTAEQRAELQKIIGERISIDLPGLGRQIGGQRPGGEGGFRFRRGGEQDGN